MMRVCQQVTHAAAAHLRTWGITPAQFDVLAHVGAAEGIHQQDLADSLLVTKGNITQLLDRMEQCGWLVRRQDGRVKRIHLTPSGRCLFDVVIPAHEAFIACQFAALDLEAQRVLQRHLRVVDRALHRQVAASLPVPSDDTTAATGPVAV